MMASLKLQTEQRNSLYFGKYRYKARCTVNGASYTYYTKSLEEFKAKMAKRAQNLESVSTRVEIMLGNWRTHVDTVDYEQIGHYFEWRNNVPNQNYMLRIQRDHINVYSDDLSLLKTLVKIDEDVKISMAEVLNNDVIYFKKEPKHRYRTYFRGKKMPDNFKQDLNSFIERYNNTATVCPALRRLALESNSRWYGYLHSSYYVDYDEQSTLTLLHMFFGSMLAKTFSLEKEPFYKD